MLTVNRWVCDGCGEEQSSDTIATSRLEKRLVLVEGNLTVTTEMAHYCPRCWRRPERRPRRVQGKAL